MSIRAKVMRKLATLWRSSRVLGKRFTVRMYLSNLISPDGHAYDENMDEDWGIDTSGDYGFTGDELPGGLADDADGYEGTRVDVVRHAIGLVPVDRATTEFWDLGSGKGKVAFIAADEGYRNIVGVELNQALHSEALSNRATVQHRIPDATIDLRCESATEIEYPDGPLVVFMFNPFRRKVFSDAVTLLEQRAQRSDAPLWIIYVHPLEHDRMLASPHFDLIAEETVTPFWWSSYIYRSTSSRSAADRAMGASTTG